MTPSNNCYCCLVLRRVGPRLRFIVVASSLFYHSSYFPFESHFFLSLIRFLKQHSDNSPPGCIKEQLWRSWLHHSVTYFKTRSPPWGRKTYHCLHQAFHPLRFHRQFQSSGVLKCRSGSGNPQTMRVTESISVRSVLETAKSCQS